MQVCYLELWKLKVEGTGWCRVTARSIDCWSGVPVPWDIVCTLIATFRFFAAEYYNTSLDLGI